MRAPRPRGSTRRAPSRCRHPDSCTSGVALRTATSRDRALLAECRGVPVGADLEYPGAGPAGDRDPDGLVAAVLAPPELHGDGRGVTPRAARRLVVPEDTGAPFGLPGDWTVPRPCPGGGYAAAVCVLGKDWTVVSTDCTGPDFTGPDLTGRTPGDRPPTERGTAPHGPALPRSGGPAARHG
ncbi:hypothetical protein [Streptomyces sp. NPDC102462]|uniref:hypothetical protein n=1 Tax=Streptomyces sp. NPDC102462 TaxID=3366178 RepID=UPI00380AAE90